MATSQIMNFENKIHWYLYQYLETNNIELYILTSNVPLQIGRCTPRGTCNPTFSGHSAQPSLDIIQVLAEQECEIFSERPNKKPSQYEPQIQGLPVWRNFSHLPTRPPCLDYLSCMFKELGLLFERDWLVHTWCVVRRHQVTTLGQSWPENNDGLRVFKYPKTAELSNDSPLSISVCQHAQDLALHRFVTK